MPSGRRVERTLAEAVEDFEAVLNVKHRQHLPVYVERERFANPRDGYGGI